jgi:hypothetical protein
VASRVVLSCLSFLFGLGLEHISITLFGALFRMPALSKGSIA